MCLRVQLVLPTLKHFLLIYSLRFGCFLIFLWTILRSLFCIFLLTIAIEHSFIQRNTPLGSLGALIKTLHPKMLEPKENEFTLSANKHIVTKEVNITVFYCQLAMLVNEAVLLIYASIYLGGGICLKKYTLIKHFISGRILTWLVEVSLLVMLLLNHQALFVWYLIIAMFVVLDAYSVVVVNSYYQEKTVKYKHSHNASTSTM